ncbi:MAG: extensin family protein [Pseudomonadota bacterium]
MAQDAARKARKTISRGHGLISAAAAFAFAALLAFGGYQAVVHPDTPLPPQWNPTEPLVISDPVTPLTGWKLNRAVADPATCLATLEGFATLIPLDPLEENDQCFISDRVDLQRVGQSLLAPVETRCAIALRMAMWERHSVQPAAREFFGTDVARIQHIGSYNCRRLRTPDGPSARMSTHATADAIDITGFDLVDGTRLRLIEDWGFGDSRAAFLRAVRDGACDYFSLTLSPDYNRLHADHFHLQSRGWGLCR